MIVLLSWIVGQSLMRCEGVRLIGDSCMIIIFDGSIRILVVESNY